MIKRIILISALSFIMLTNSFAQKAKVVSAWNYLNNKEYANAKAAIDEAINDETTKASAKTWYYRGNIYLAIYKDTTHEVTYPEALTESYNAYKKAIELDTKGDYKDDIKNRLFELAYFYFNDGVLPYNNKNYKESYKYFSTASEVYQMLNKNYEQKLNDSLAIFYAANSAYELKDYANALTLYNKLLTNGYLKPEIYTALTQIYLEQKDTTTAVAMIQNGMKQFPNDNDMRIKELNIYLGAKKYNEALSKLQAAAAADPKSAEIQFALGNAYENMKDTANARMSYLKAIELKPDYFEVVFTLGTMYFNQAADLNDKLMKVDIKDQKKYDELKNLRNIMLTKAQPYLEKAQSLRVDDYDTLIALKQLYANTNQTEKYNEVKAKMDMLKK